MGVLILRDTYLTHAWVLIWDGMWLIACMGHPMNVQVIQNLCQLCMGGTLKECACVFFFLYTIKKWGRKISIATSLGVTVKAPILLKNMHLFRKINPSSSPTYDSITTTTYQTYRSNSQGYRRRCSNAPSYFTNILFAVDYTKSQINYMQSIYTFRY